jgi:hypothetical protein
MEVIIRGRRCRRRQVHQQLLDDDVRQPFNTVSSSSSTAVIAAASADSFKAQTAPSTRSISHSCDGQEPSPSIGFPAPASRSVFSSSTLSIGLFSSTAEMISISLHKPPASRELFIYLFIYLFITIIHSNISFIFIFDESLYTNIFENTVKHFSNYGIIIIPY